MSFWIKPQTPFFFFYRQARVSFLRWAIKEWSKAPVPCTHQRTFFFSLKRTNFNWRSPSPSNSGTCAPLPWIPEQFQSEEIFYFALLLLPDMSGCWCKIIATWQWLLRAAVLQLLSQGHQLKVTEVLSNDPLPFVSPLRLCVLTQTYPFKKSLTHFLLSLPTWLFMKPQP